MQTISHGEIGLFTDRIDLEPEVSWDLDAFLEQWERAHPKADPTYRDRKLPSDLAERLKNLGYMGGDEDVGDGGDHPGPP